MKLKQPLRIDTSPASAFRAKADSLLAEVNGRARAHTYNCASDILCICTRIDKRLDDLGVPKAQRVGLVAHAESGVPTAKAYARKSRTARASYVKLTRRKTGWFIDAYSVVDRYTGPGGEAKVKIDLTPEVAATVQRKALERAERI